MIIYDTKITLSYLLMLISMFALIRTKQIIKHLKHQIITELRKHEEREESKEETHYTCLNDL